ncbi:MAG: monovalent cation/H+ antiporter complex subunit F [Actinomycetota bacterium]
MEEVTLLALGVLAAAALLCSVRLSRGPSLANRIVALDTLLVVIVAGVAVGAIRTGRSVFLDFMVVAALLGFIGTVTVARAIEGRNKQ